MKLAIKIDQDLPFDKQAFITYLENYSAYKIEVNEVKRSNYGIGADLMVMVATILTGYAAVKHIFEFPSTVKKLPQYYEDWKELIGFITYIEKEYQIASYPIEAVFANALDSICSRRGTSEAILLRSYEVASRHGGNPEIPASYDNSRIIYWNFSFQVSDYYYFQTWDSKLRLLSEVIVNADPRIAEKENKDIREK